MTYTNRPRVVVSLYDFTGEALRPWAERGYTCHAFDIQHPREGTFSDGIHYRHADLHSRETLEDIKNEFKNGVAFAMAFPVCTDLAVSGARHFKRKAEQDPHFQDVAAGHAMACAQLFDDLNVPFFIENPVSVLASVWRKPACGVVAVFVCRQGSRSNLWIASLNISSTASSGVNLSAQKTYAALRHAVLLARCARLTFYNEG